MARLLLEVNADDRAGPILARIANQLNQIPRIIDQFGRQIQSATNEANRGLKQISDETLKGSQSLGTLASAANDLKGIFLGFVGVHAAIRGLGIALHEALEEEQALRRLSTALSASNISFDENRGRITEWASELERTTTFTDEQFIGALAKATTRLGDLAESQKLVALASRVAAATGRDLGSATEFLAESLFTGERGLRTMHREFGQMVSGARNSAEALELLNQRLPETASQAVGGEAALNRIGKAARNVAEDIGRQLLVSIDFLNKISFPKMGQAASETGSVIDGLGDKLLRLAEQKRRLRLGADLFQDLPKTTKDIEIAERAASKALARETKERNDFARKNAKTAAEFRQRSSAEESANREAELKKALDEEEEADQKLLKEEEEKDEKAIGSLERFYGRTREFQAKRLEAEGNDAEAATLNQEIENERRLDLVRQEAEEAGIINVEKTEAFRAAQELNRAESDETARRLSLGFQATEGTAKAVTGSISSGFGNAFADAILEGKDLEQSLNAVFNNVKRVAIQTFTEIAVRIAIIRGATAIFPGLAPFLSAQHGTLRVPGPVGTPVPITAHGGETIVPVGGAIPFAGASDGAGISPLTGSAGAQSVVGYPSGNIIGSLTVNLNLRVADLDPAERARVVNALVAEIRQATVAAREFAGELATLTARQAGSTV